MNSVNNLRNPLSGRKKRCIGLDRKAAGVVGVAGKLLSRMNIIDYAMVGMTNSSDRDGKCTNSSKEKNERLLFGADRCLALHPDITDLAAAFMADAEFESLNPTSPA